jgi:Ca2+-binding EF-hand superfamily protein
LKVSLLEKFQSQGEKAGFNLKDDNSMKWSSRAFRAIDTDSRGYIFKDELLNHIKASGTMATQQLAQLVQTLEAMAPRDPISLSAFDNLICGINFIKNVLENNLAVPQFTGFV